MELFHYFSRYQREKMRKKQLLWLKKFFGRRPVLLKKLCDWAKELQLKPDELRNELLLSKDNLNNTAWHLAAKSQL